MAALQIKSVSGDFAVNAQTGQVLPKQQLSEADNSIRFVDLIRYYEADPRRLDKHEIDLSEIGYWYSSGSDNGLKYQTPDHH